MLANRKIYILSLLSIGLGLSVSQSLKADDLHAAFWADVSQKLTQNPEGACIVKTRCQLVQQNDSLYSYSAFSKGEAYLDRGFKDTVLASPSEIVQNFKDQVQQNISTVAEYNDRKKALDKDVLAPGIKEVMDKISTLTSDLDPEELSRFQEAVEFELRHYLNGEKIPEALQLLPEAIEIHITLKTAKDAKPVTFTAPTAYGHSTAGGSALNDVELMELWVTKFSEIAKGILACEAEMRQLDNIPRCSE